MKCVKCGKEARLSLLLSDSMEMPRTYAHYCKKCYPYQEELKEYLK